MWSLPVVVMGVVVLADNNPATDDVKRMIGYQGTLELDGVAKNGLVSLELALYPEPGATASIYRQCFTPALVGGRFSVVLGPTGVTGGDGEGCDDTGVNLATVVNDANDLHVGVTVHDPVRGRVALSGRQRVLPVPYSFWATEAANFKVNNDLSVTGNAQVAGALSADSLTVAKAVSARAYAPGYSSWAVLGTGEGGAGIYNDNNVYKALMVVGNNSGGGARRVGVWDDFTVNGTATVNGLVANTTDFILDAAGRRPVGTRPLQRALVHEESDVLVVNYDGDFEGGTRMDSSVTVTGNLTVNGNLTVSGRIQPNYDSGWTAVTAASTSVEFPHNFGGAPSRVLIQTCGAVTATPWGNCTTRIGLVADTGHQDGGSYLNPLDVTTDLNKVYVGLLAGWWVWGYWCGTAWCYTGDADNNPATGFYRVLAWR
jgi:hypothetical protein